jgi:hypothetical protein
MGFSLEKVVPWGRSLEEYTAMFALSGKDKQKHILGCGDGPASFNAELTKEGGNVISIDPIYQFQAEEIQKRIDETYSKVMEETEKNQNEFVWKNIKNPEELGQTRMKAMKLFLEDYPTGLKEKRYMPEELPKLPFKDKEFDIALCSHFLFLYSEQLPLDFHIQSIKELCRVAKEIRIFPLLELGAVKSRHINATIEILEKNGYKCKQKKVPYEFQKGGNEMLLVKVAT